MYIKRNIISTLKNAILIHATTWMNFQNILLDEITTNYCCYFCWRKIIVIIVGGKFCMIPFIQNVQVVKFIETEKRRGYQSPGREGN